MHGKIFISLQQLHVHGLIATYHVTQHIYIRTYADIHMNKECRAFDKLLQYQNDWHIRTYVFL